MEVDSDKPLLICMTPVRNEAWILDVFLKLTSLWADYIIIADQNSTDNSREIAERYEKVILIENNVFEFNESERQSMLINEARKIKGDKILFALDADEIFTANFQQTNDWKRIINSSSGEVFGFQWANILPDKKHYYSPSFYFPWVVNDDGITKHKNYVRYIHSMRIPFPDKAESGYYEVKDFKVLHFAYYHQRRFISKNRFYKCTVKVNEPDFSFISLSRTYYLKKQITNKLPINWISIYERNGISIFDEINLNEQIFWFDISINKYISDYGYDRFKYLDIWDKNWINSIKPTIEVNDPRNFFIRILHFYLKITQKYTNTIIIRIIDKVLKIIGI